VRICVRFEVGIGERASSAIEDESGDDCDDEDDGADDDSRDEACAAMGA